MMNKTTFDRDELAIVSIYKSDSPTESIAKMEEVIPYIDDPDMVDLVQATIEKVKNLDFAEFQELDLKNYQFLFEEDEDNGNK